MESRDRSDFSLQCYRMVDVHFLDFLLLYHSIPAPFHTCTIPYLYTAMSTADVKAMLAAGVDIIMLGGPAGAKGYAGGHGLTMTLCIIRRLEHLQHRHQLQHPTCSTCCCTGCTSSAAPCHRRRCWDCSRLCLGLLDHPQNRRLGVPPEGREGGQVWMEGGSVPGP